MPCSPKACVEGLNASSDGARVCVYPCSFMRTPLASIPATSSTGSLLGLSTQACTTPLMVRCARLLAYYLATEKFERSSSLACPPKYACLEKTDDLPRSWQCIDVFYCRGVGYWELWAFDALAFLFAGFERIVLKESGTFKYFLKIVPTEYIKLNGERSSLHLHSCAALASLAACADKHAYWKSLQVFKAITCHPCPFLLFVSIGCHHISRFAQCSAYADSVYHSPFSTLRFYLADVLV